MARNRRIWAVDCETDPAQYGRVPIPFLWGAFDGTHFLLFHSTEEFVAWAVQQDAILYAHNGGKFDFMFLIIHVKLATKAQVINGRIVKMNMGRAELRDSFAIIHEPLSKFGKFEIDYRKLEANVREENMPEIIDYLKQDCVVLYQVVDRFRQIAGTQTTIASNALKFSKRLGVNPGKTNHTYDKNLRQYYYGGRCEVFEGGTQENIRVIDIHSAYPFAMCHDHASGAEWVHITPDEFKSLPREEQQRAFVHLRCYSHGAFPARTDSELIFPRDRMEFKVTGWEYVAAVELDLIKAVEILDVIVHDATINFSPYVNHWYAEKSRWDKELNPIEYEIAKRMMNSLYGKLSQNILRYYDYKIAPGGTHICFDFRPTAENGTLCECGELDANHGWEIYTEYLNVEIHRRPALWKWNFKYGKQWEGQLLYNNVGTGASITGFTRAHLLRAIHAVGFHNVLYCDTDSIICRAAAPLDKLSLSDALGDWADEGTASIGHFAGKKIYGLRMDAIDKKTGLPKEKIASKGSKLKFSEIEALMRGETVNWKSDFPAFSVAGEPSFVVRNIRQTAKPTGNRTLH